MAKKEPIEKYTADELRAKQARGESQSDWARAAALTAEEIERAIAEDEDEANMVVDWTQATVELPQPKAVLHMRVDREVMDFFRSQGRGYQTKINAVLRTYVETMRQNEKQ